MRPDRSKTVLLRRPYKFGDSPPKGNSDTTRPCGVQRGALFLLARWSSTTAQLQSFRGKSRASASCGSQKKRSTKKEIAQTGYPSVLAGLLLFALHRCMTARIEREPFARGG